METYYRAFLQREYSDDRDNWKDQGWAFFKEDPTEYINGFNNIGTDRTSYYYPTSNWRIKYLHIISEEDYNGRKIYTKPIEQIIFY